MLKMHGTDDNFSMLAGQVMIYKATPKLADADGIVDGGATSATVATTLTCNYYLDIPRFITCTTGGTAANIKAVKATIYGVDPNGNEISEELAAFTADEASTKSSSKCFAYVEKVVVPAMDGAGVTIDVGWAKEIWLPCLASDKLVLIDSWFDGSAETTDATFTADATATEESYITADSHASFDGAKEFVARFTCE